MPTLVNGMEQTTGQELDDVQRAIEASLALEKYEQAQKEVEMAQVDHAINETLRDSGETAARQKTIRSANWGDIQRGPFTLTSISLYHVTMAATNPSSGFHLPSSI